MKSWLKFAEFFITKIKKIREELDDKGIYSLDSNGYPTNTLSELDKFTNEEVASIIKLMPSNMCELDPKLVDLLTKTLDGLLPTLTKILNLSLGTATFAKS